MPAIPINYWAVLVSGILSMVLGFLYYGPFFGKMYIELMGWSNMDPAKSAEMKKGMSKRYAVAFVMSLLMAWVLAHAVFFAQTYMHTSGMSAGLITGFMSWLGFVAPVTVGLVLWGTQSTKLWLLNNVYYVVQFLVIGALLGTWK